AAVPAHAEESLLAAVAEDRVGCVAGVPASPLAVGGLAVNAIGERVVEEQLAGVNHAAADVHLHMDVDGTAGVPARIYGEEDGQALRVRALDAPHEGRVGTIDSRVVAERIAVPDVHRGVLDRAAGGGVQHGQVERQRGAGPALADFAPHLLAGDVVRALGEL